MNAKLCRHFGTCGGCAYQDMEAGAYRALKRNAVIDALNKHGLGGAVVDDTIQVAPNTRRRASFKVLKRNGNALLGFHAAASHDIVDMRECWILTPAMFALAAGLRAMMNALLDEGQKAELFVTETNNGPDVEIKWQRTKAAGVAGWAAKLKLARVTAGGEFLAELAQPVVTFGGADVALPEGAFLQPTRAGEEALQTRVLELLDKSKSLADLFAGCGTFSLPLARKARVHAVELDRAALAALGDAARKTQGLKPITTEPRDLFKLPLGVAELERFDSVLLDPPRAGASAQAKELAKSKIRRIVYVSCNADSFARDAGVLVAGGYTMGHVLPVDQFLWSSHIELVTGFTRG